MFYGGYLRQDIQDYFFQDGLRPTHNGVLEGMDPALRGQVQPYFRDLVPWPPILAELPRATQNAWGTYLEDLYNQGQIADTSTRRETATYSGLTVGMLAAIDTTVSSGSRDRRVGAVKQFYESVQGSLMGLEAPTELAQGLAEKPQIAAVGLAGHIRTRFFTDNNLLRDAVVHDVGSLAEATQSQLRSQASFESGHTKSAALKSSLVGVAEKFGGITASIVLRRTELRDPQNPRDYPEGRIAAEALGKVGGYWRHSRDIPGAFRSRRLTYAAAIILRHGGATSAALQEITAVRDDSISTAVRQGRVALEPGNTAQQGIFNMALHLLHIKAGVLASRGSRRQIDYWMREAYPGSRG